MGVIDGKYVNICVFLNFGLEYFNYKKYLSFVLLVIVDVNVKIILFDVGFFGS